ncbi:MAG: efflux RND transporter periplasmic adaptor subunit [Phocaeicola sp.]
MKKQLLFPILTLLGVLTACGGGEQNYEGPRPLHLMEITPQTITLSRNYSASIRGRQDIRIIPRVDGYLTKIGVKEGEQVKKGQALFVIDQVAYLAALEGAKAEVALQKANVATAQLNYESQQALYAKMIVSEYDLKLAQNNLKTAEAYLLQAESSKVVAQNNLSFTQITSPSDGVIGKLPYRLGDYVSPTIAEGLTVVADNREMYIYFSMSEAQLMELMEEYKDLQTAIEQLPPVQLQLSNQRLYPHTGKIESISGIIEGTTGAASIRAVFPNSEGKLLSGGAGSVVIPQSLSSVAVIPQEATFEIQDKTFAYKVVNGMTQLAPIEVSKINNGKEYVVMQGLNSGDTIVVQGAGLLQEGIAVTAIQ